MSDSIIYYLFMMVLRRSPMLLLAVAAIIIAAMRWKQHPRVSLLTIIAMIVYWVDAFVFSTLVYYVPYILKHVESLKTVQWIYFFIYFFDDFVTAATIILLVTAAFIGRRTSPASAAMQGT